MEHAKHIIRAISLLVLGTVLFVLARHFAIPKSFGEYGHYRADSIHEYNAQIPQHGGDGACVECHDEEAEVKVEGKHASVQCETCHGPLSGHVENEVRVAEMVVNSSNELCAWCHQRLLARPKTFPQVVFPDHVTEKGAEMSESICLECHDAHNPSE